MSVEGKVLIVDPEPMVVELIERRLARAGFQTASASSAKDAIAAAPRELPDVVLLSMSLPDATGFATLTKLRAIPALAGVSIALVAAMQRDPESLERGLELGADDYLRKPIEPIELVARVKSLLLKRRHIAELERKTARLVELNAELERIAIKDALTGLYNRRYMEERLRVELERVRRYGQPLSLVMADVDFFKKVNDTYGHPAGDAVLKVVAATMEAAIRSVDLCARLGGEEFVLVAPATSAEAALLMAERVRAAVEAAEIRTLDGKGAEVTLKVTSSFGVATAMGGVDSGAAELLAAADAALYRAKKGGRNRVELA